MDELAPLEGALPRRLCGILAPTLAPFTRSPAECWFCLWEGNGAFWSGAHSALDVPGDPSLAARIHRADARAQDEYLREMPKVATYARDYFLLRGPLEAMCAFEIDGWYDTPNLCWPDDRAWLLETEVDGYSTYVGGSDAAIDAVLAHPELETVEVFPDTRMDVGPYPPRWRS
jgi:hypothetical protein